MIQVIQAQQREPKRSFGQKLSEGIGRGLDVGSQLMEAHNQKQAISKEDASVLKEYGINLSGIKDPKIRQDIVNSGLKGKLSENETARKLQANDIIIKDLEQRNNLPEGSLSAYRENPAMAEKVSRPQKTEGGITSKPVPPEISSKIRKILKDYPNASADELRISMDEAEIPTVYSNAYTENRRRTEEQSYKSKEDYQKALRAETLPIRKEIAEKAQTATQGIQNKEHLLDLIKNGDLNDPTFAALAQSLPLNLGKRLLSNDTVEYKSGLVEEFKDLRNIFQGQTRVKEIELLEEKIADIYLTDAQKETILKSRINALKADQIRAEVAQEMENEPYGVLQFNNELQKRSKSKLEGLFNKVLDEQKAVIQDAENKKKIPLDPKDPEDLKIMQQIKKEANGNKEKAKKIAKEKGYSWVGI